MLSCSSTESQRLRPVPIRLLLFGLKLCVFKVGTLAGSTTTYRPSQVTTTYYIRQSVNFDLTTLTAAMLGSRAQAYFDI